MARLDFGRLAPFGRAIYLRKAELSAARAEEMRAFRWHVLLAVRGLRISRNEMLASTGKARETRFEGLMHP
jgi:hypothetical protein